MKAALGSGRTAANADNPGFALAGLWLQVLADADSRLKDRAWTLFPELVAKDSNIPPESQVETEMQPAPLKLMDIRKKHNLPRVCGRVRG